MKAVYTSLGFALGTSAASLVARDQCCFGLTAAGGKSGVVGQLSDGQNRIGQTAGLATGTANYCINNGGLTDENGRGCILTPPTTQFQCDAGAAPTTGFSVVNGELEHNGNSTFYACPTGDNGGYNIYTTPVANQQGCVEITLSTGGQCNGAGVSSSAAASSSTKPASSSAAASTTTKATSSSVAPAPSSSKPASSSAASTSTTQAAVTTTIWHTNYVTVTSCANTCAGSAPASFAPASSAPASFVPASSASSSSAPSSSAPASSAPASGQVSSAPASMTSAAASTTASGTASGTACGTSLAGAYQTPHAIIPINSESSTKSYGTQYNAYIGGGNSTIFNFDIPASYAGKTCSVIFLFPEQSQLETSSFTESGTGGLDFDLLSSAAPLTVTYDSAPSVESHLDTISSVTPGHSWVIASGACAAGTTQSIEVSAVGQYELEFFEDWNPSPIGLFMTSC